MFGRSRRSAESGGRVRAWIASLLTLVLVCAQVVDGGLVRIHAHDAIGRHVHVTLAHVEHAHDAADHHHHDHDDSDEHPPGAPDHDQDGVTVEMPTALAASANARLRGPGPIVIALPSAMARGATALVFRPPPLRPPPRALWTHVEHHRTGTALLLDSSRALLC